MTRHELKDQVEHDQFTDVVSGAYDYAVTHKESFIRWGIVAAVVLAIIGCTFWYLSYRNSVRQQDLQAAFAVLETPVGAPNAADPTAKTFLTQDQKTKASMKALSNVVAKDGGSRQGLMAQYYLGTLKAQNGDAAGAEADLKRVADSSTQVAALAKIALAQLYAGQNKTQQARSLLQDLVNKPTDLVSKGQAKILLAHLDETANPQQAKQILQSLKADQDPAVSRAADQLSSQSAK